MPTTTITAEIVSDDLAAPAAEIAAINSFHRQANAAADAARSKAEEAAHFAVLAGIRLEALRSTFQHGGWSQLFASGEMRHNSESVSHLVLDFSKRTAERYIELARRIRLEQRLSTKAQKRLSTIADVPEIDEESRGFLSKITEGRNLRQLYLDLEIIAAPDKEPKEPKTPAQPAIRKSREQAMLEDAREFFYTWRERAAALVKNGYLDALDKKGLEEMKEFQGWLRDRINARLSNL